MRKTVFTATALVMAGWACAGMAAPRLPFGLPSIPTPFHKAPPAPDSFPNVPYSTWSNAEPAYRIYPGDEIEVVLPTAPTFNKVLTVRPDGRVALPVTNEEMMAAGRTLEDVRAEASQRLSSQLIRPIVEMQVKPQPIKIYVGGEVKNPGEYALVGDDNALQAIIKAGGFTTSADLKHVQIVRRVADGPNALKNNVDLSEAFRHGRQQPDLVPLARQDVIYVPRTGLANIGVAVQQFLAALPVTFTYSVNGNIR